VVYFFGPPCIYIGYTEISILTFRKKETKSDFSMKIFTVVEKDAGPFC